LGDLVASVESPLGENGVQARLIGQGEGNPRVFDVYWIVWRANTIKAIQSASIAGTTGGH